MTHQRCNSETTKGQCKNTFRSRRLHSLCRSCYRTTYGRSRPIESRELSENKNRRTRNRRGFIAKSKSIVNKSNSKRSKQTQPLAE